MDQSIHTQMANIKDKKLFTQTFVRTVTSKEDLTNFIADYGIDNLNATIRTLESDDRARVVGRVHSINLNIG